MFSHLLSRWVITSIVLLSSSMAVSFAATPTVPPSTSTAPSGGFFAQYFQNIASNNCTFPSVVSWFDITTSLNYLKPTCINVNSIIGSYLVANPIAASQWNNVAWGLSYTAGNVGIGTANPTALLEIGTTRPVRFDTNAGITSRGDAGGWAMGNFYEWSAGTPRWGFGAYGSADTLNYLYVGTYTTPSMVWMPGGNVGIGTIAPWARLEIASTTDNRIRLTKTSGSNWNYVEFMKWALRTSWMGTDNLWWFGIGSDNPLSDMYIDWFRNIGIGTRTPSEKLEVVGNVAVSGNVTAVGFFHFSDKSLKKNILPLDNSLEKLLRISGYSFEWRSDNRKDIGIIAQEVEKEFPELVKTDAHTGLKSVQYENLIAPLIEGMKEQQKMIEKQKVNSHELLNEQQKTIDSQKVNMRSLETRLEAIEKSLQDTEKK